MQLMFRPARLTGFAILAVAGATALSVGACSSKSPDKSSPSSANDEAKVYGLVASVSGGAVQVTEATGTAAVDVSPSAKIIENTNAQLTDVAAGNCVRVVPTAASAPGGAVAAKSVVLTPQGGNGKCPQPKNAAAPTPGAPPPGTVASVAGNIIHVTVTDANGNPSQTDVTVSDATHYIKQASATAEAIAQGKCITALGTKDGGGTLQATIVALGPSAAGKCP